MKLSLCSGCLMLCMYVYGKPKDDSITKPFWLCVAIDAQYCKQTGCILIDATRTSLTRTGVGRVPFSHRLRSDSVSTCLRCISRKTTIG